jgi:hypothetical protein
MRGAEGVDVIGMSSGAKGYNDESHEREKAEMHDDSLRQNFVIIIGVGASRRPSQRRCPPLQVPVFLLLGYWQTRYDADACENVRSEPHILTFSHVQLFPS